MGESPLNVVLDSHSLNRQNISKNSQRSENGDSILLSDSATFSHNPNPDYRNNSFSNELNLSNNDEEFLSMFNSQSFDDYVKYTDNTLLRRYSCPCFQSEYNFNSFNFSNDLNVSIDDDDTSDRIFKSKICSRFRSLDDMKCIANLRNNTWGSLIHRFRKFCLDSNKNGFNKSSNLSSDFYTSLRNPSDLILKSVDKPLSSLNGEPIQYAVFKPINLSLNAKTKLLNGFVSSKEDKEDVVFVVKSNTGQSITKYGLTRIISCNKRQEYEVVDHNTGDYYLLKLTNDVNIFNIYESLFDQPHPNLVEVVQLLTNVDSNCVELPSFRLKNGQIFYILLNSFKYTALTEYHINTLPSLIDFNVLKLIIKGLLKALVYLHSKSITLSKLSMKSVILCRSCSSDFESDDEIVAKIVDLDDARVSRSYKDFQNDIKLVGGLLYHFIEGKQTEKDYVFKSNLWTLCPQMFDFCVTALARLSSFKSASEALIHPWITSIE